MVLPVLNEQYVREQESGFSLIEFLLAAGIGLLLLAAMTVFFAGSVRLYGLQSGQARLGQEMHMALVQMRRDIRMAGFDPLGTGAFGFTSLGGIRCEKDSLAFTQDMNANGVVDGDPEQIGYRLHKKKYIQRYSTGSQPWQPLTAKSKTMKITKLEFLYWLRDGVRTESPAGQLGEIVAVRIDICGQVQGRFGLKNKETCLQEWIWVRNSVEF